MSKHIQKIRSECQPQMANFLWLLRDMDLNLGTTSPTEWLLQKLQAPRCKEISEGLTNSFSRIECAFLPPPAVENELLQDIIQRKDQLTPHFNTHVEETKVQILSAIESKLCAGAPVSAFSMTSLIEKCVSEINHQMNIPVLDAKWKIAIEMQLQEYASKLAAEYEKDMASKVRNLLPIEEGSLKSSDKVTLMGIHNEILEKKCSMLESKLASLVPTKDIHNIFWKIVQQEFVSKIVEKDSNGQVNGGKLLMFLHENYQISSEACSKTYTKFYDQIVASKLRFAIAEGIPYDIAPDVAEFEEKYNRIACGPAKAKVFTDSRILSEIDEHQLKLIPGHIEDLKVIGINNNRIKLTWSRPLVNPSAAHSYEVYITKEDGSLILVETTKNCYALIQNLESNKQYTFVVRAKNDQFSGSYVSHVAAKTTLTSVARSAVGIGTFLALTIGSPVVFPAMFSIGTIFSIRNDIREKRIGSAAAKGLGLALMPLALPVGVLGTMVAAPCIAIDAFESHGPVGDLSTSVSEERREAV